MRNSSADSSFAAKTFCTFVSLVLLFLFLHPSNVEGIQVERSTAATEQQNIHEQIEGKKTLDNADEFEVDYTPPRGHPPTQPPPLKGNSYGEEKLGTQDSLTMTHPPEHYPDGEHEMNVDYSPPKTHPPKSPPTYNSDNEDDFGVDYSPPTTHPPKSPPTYNSDNEDEFGVDYSPPTTHPPKSPPTNT